MPGRVREDVSTPLAPPLLEFVDAIWRLDHARTPASLANLMRRLAVDRPEATARILALQRAGLVDSDVSGRVALTPDGERVALRLVRKHRLLERFLTDALKLPWERVHEDASRLTPVLSDEAADGLDAFLGRPATCPHGNPIPSVGGGLVAEAGIPLHRLAPGQSGLILRIEREEPELLRYLAALGLLPDTKVEVEEVAPLGGPLLVRMGDARYALGRKVAARIRVRVV